MAEDNNSECRMRQRADWMVLADDQILEVVSDLGGTTAMEVAAHTDYSREHISRRMRMLKDHGLLECPYSTYRITDVGLAYLDEEFDASTLEKDEE